MKKKFFLKNSYVLLPIFILILYTNVFSQVVIKEKIEFNPEAETDTSFLGCNYDLFDSTEVTLRFTPENIESGETAIMKLWIGEYEYDEDAQDIIQRTVTVEPPAYGEIIRIGNGEYLFTASDTITVDSILVTVNYENFSRYCWLRPLGNDSGVAKQTGDCLECFPYSPGLTRYYGSEQITIKRDSLDVMITPSEIFAGDTAQVIIKKRLPDGTLVDFDTTQTFEIGMLEGCILGKIHAGGVDTNYIYGVTQPIYFVADTSVADSGEVLLRAGLIEETLKSNKQTDNPESYCFIGSYVSPTYDDASVIVKNPLEIIYPKSTTEEWITADPQMPNVICKARLKNYNNGSVNFEWEYWVRYTLYRHAYYTADTLCRRTGMIKITGTSNANNSDTTSWTVSFTTSNLDSVEFKAMQPVIPNNPDYGGDCDEVRNSWTEGENVFTGGNVFVQVTAKNSSGQTIGFRQLNAGAILGNNPTSQTIQDYASTTELRAIIYHESLIKNERWKQFNPQDNDLYYSTFNYTLEGWKYNKKGYPAYGIPNGYGLAKIDNLPPSEMDLWNWKNNVDTGRERLEDAKANSNDYIITKGATNEEDKYWMNAFQKYNGGRYWNWVKGKGWEKNPNRPKNEYGKILFEKYQELN